MRSMYGKSVVFAMLLAAAACARQSTDPELGERLVALTEGDYVHPRFSPSGSHLAVAEVARVADGESTQIVVLNVRSQQLDTLLTALEAWRFATYSAFVTKLSWTDDSTLVAHISDGDVDATEVSLRLGVGVIATTALANEHDEWPMKVRPLADTLATLYPHIAPDSSVSAARVFDSGLDWGVARSGNVIIMQKRYARVDDDVWAFRLDTPAATRLAGVSDGPRTTVSGGFGWRGGIVFAFGADSTTVAFYDGTDAAFLATVPVVRQQHRLSAVASLPHCAWLLIRSGPTSSPSANAVFRFDSRRLQRLVGVDSIQDFVMEPTGRIAAFTRWRGNHRALYVHAVNRPCAT